MESHACCRDGLSQEHNQGCPWYQKEAMGHKQRGKTSKCLIILSGISKKATLGNGGSGVGGLRRARKYETAIDSRLELGDGN